MNRRTNEYIDEIIAQARRAGNTTINASCITRALYRALQDSGLIIGMCEGEQEIYWEIIWALRGKSKNLKYSVVVKDL